ncbi:mannose-6-phosphate isomerase, class I [Thermodesulfobacteriota bacterium]
MKKIAYLQNSIQNYAWGSRTFIPELTGNSNPDEKPHAELWMGTHPKAPSNILCNDNAIPLPEAIQKDPDGILGHSVSKKFNKSLPFLFKILAAADPLSVQAHPDKARAERGFAKENTEGIPIDAPDRNYRDSNHKPELICALEPMWILKGFRTPEDIVNLFNMAGLTSDNFGLEKFNDHGAEKFLKDLFQSLMILDREQQVLTINILIEHVKKTENAEPEFKWVSKLNQYYPGDISVLSLLFLNLIRLQPGQAIYIPAGELHAYLEGSGLEIMANSDNVLRGGLTPKHIDLTELLRILNFSPGVPEINIPLKISEFEAAYPAKAEEFILSVISLDNNDTYCSQLNRNVEIMICTGGSARIREIDSEDELKLNKGSSIIVPASVEQYQIEGEATIYKASVPN